MRHVSSLVAALLLAVACMLRAVSALAAPAESEPVATHPLTARGPVSLSLAAGPSGLHWGLETGFPLGLAHRDATGRLLSPAGPWRLDAIVNATHDRTQSLDVATLATSLRLERADARGATWWGISRGGPREPGAPDASLRLGLGRTGRFAGMRADVSWVTSSVLFKNDPRWFQTRSYRYFTPSDTGPGTWTDTTVTERSTHSALWNTAHGSLRWQRGRLALESVAGLSAGDGVHARRWAQATVNLQLTRRVLFMASLGEQPAPAMAFRSGAQPRSMLGLQFAPWSSRGWAMSGEIRPKATAWRSQSLSSDQLLVRVHAHDVKRVELAGDFTDWLPLELLPVHANWWAAVVRVPPGVHRVQLRLDGGAWLAPPGLPRADDGPGGASGTLFVSGLE